MRQQIELRDMELLLALAQHQHFAKAAEACQISQPALSMRIRNLEELLGLAIVRRGNRFLGFTEKGNTLLRHARGILEDVKAMEQELGSAGGAITGSLVLGVVPTALTFAAQLCAKLHEAHPNVLTRIESTSSIAIQQGLEDGTIDAGVTYDDSVSEDLVTITHLYEEEYVLLAPDALVEAGQLSITWKDAANLPMTLLEPGMQNRRIIDRMFKEVGVRPELIAESNGFVAAIIMAQDGVAATIIPKVLADGLGGFRGARTLPLTDPDLVRGICLATPMRTPSLPAVDALKRLTRP